MSTPELKDQIINFYHLLAKENNSIASKCHWAIFFDLPGVMGGAGAPGAYAASNQVLYSQITSRENRGAGGDVITGAAPWQNIQNVKEIVFNNLIKKYGWLYASSVTVPGDKYGIQTLGEFSIGFAKGNIGTGRGQFTNLSIDFYDTQASVTDYILRPWMILLAHNGLKIATAKSKIHVLPLMKKSGKVLDNVPRKIFTYFNCYPTTIGEERLDHQDGSPTTKSVTFTYDWYSVTNVAENAFKTPQLTTPEVDVANENLGSGFA